MQEKWVLGQLANCPYNSVMTSLKPEKQRSQKIFTLLGVGNAL